MVLIRWLANAGQHAELLKPGRYMLLPFCRGHGGATALRGASWSRRSSPIVPALQVPRRRLASNQADGSSQHALRSPFSAGPRRLVVGFLSVVGLFWGVRFFYDQVRHYASNSRVHVDQSQVVVAVKTQVPEVVLVAVTYGDGQGGDSLAVVDAAAYSKLVSRGVEVLSTAEREIKTDASKFLSAQLVEVFKPVRSRSERFADWYFAYPTTFRLLREASFSLMKHAMSVTRVVSLEEAVAADVDALVMSKYERIVLQPEINDARIREAFTLSLKHAHVRFVDAVREMNEGLVQSLSKETSHLQRPRAADIRLTLDWASQFQKIRMVPASYEKTPELTLGLAVGTALAGKAAATGALSKGGGLLASKAAAKAMTGKFASPLVAKVLAASGSAVGTIAGSLAGPIGMIAGGALGVGVDFTVNAGLALLHREDFVKDVEAVVDATSVEYFRCLELELQRVIGVWMQDAVQLLPRCDGPTVGELTGNSLD